ncbi:MAG: hypothetical protein FWE90_00490 [Defluviitaleaceae bacterium]|nr:hypothetical protein [Defluviitaleaceae bacterium]
MKNMYLSAVIVTIMLLLAGCGVNNGGNVDDDDAYDREQAEIELLRSEVGNAIQNNRYASAIKLLNYLDDFPEANALRRDAEHGIFRSDMIRRINELFIINDYEGVLAILDATPQFDDDMNFRNDAEFALTMKENETQTGEEELQILRGFITDMFRITTLEIESRNQARKTVIPRGFANPGEITLILEFDSIIRLGVNDLESINMRVEDNIVYIQRSSIRIVAESTVRNFDLVDRIRSNPLVSFNQNILNQVFEAQRELEAEMEARMVNERTIESARRNFESSFESFIRGLGFDVEWT